MRKLVLCLLMCGLIGCGSGDQKTTGESDTSGQEAEKVAAKQFHDELIALMEKSEESFDALMEFYNDYEFNEEIDVMAMSAAVDNFAAETHLEAMKQLEVPDDPECKAFHEACINLTDDSSEVAQRLEKLIDYIKEHNPATEADLEQAGTLWDEAMSSTKELSAAVTAAQKKLAEKHGFEPG